MEVLGVVFVIALNGAQQPAMMGRRTAARQWVSAQQPDRTSGVATIVKDLSYRGIVMDSLPIYMDEIHGYGRVCGIYRVFG